MNLESQPLVESPPPSFVAGNDWPAIPVPELGGWEPARRVSVILPHYEAQPQLDRTLAALTQQTYPLDLIEVVVVDDGSSEAPTIPAIAADLEASIHVQEDRGFGLARARNLGAQVATGEILIFIDCDMIPEMQHVEAHARWHHAVADAVVFGFRWHAEFDEFTPEDIATATSEGRLGELVSDQDPQRPEWVEGHIDRTDNLTGPFDDLFLVTSGGNLSIRRDLYLGIGGTDESFDQWGGEDNEFGFRAFQAGAVIVPERQAVCWHQGEGHEPSPEEVRSHRLQKPKMRNLIAELNFRHPKRGRSFTRPFVVASIDARRVSGESAASTIDSILGSDFHDLMVLVTVERSGDDAAWLERQYVSDRRVTIAKDAEPSPDELRWSPIRLGVPVGTLFHPGSLGLIVEGLGAAGVGALYITVPGFEAAEMLMTATTTCAHNRAARHATNEGEVAEWIGRLFGERWESGAWLGIGSAKVESGERPMDPRLSDVGRASAAELEAAYAALTEERSRRSMRFVNATGTLVRARSASEIASAIRSFRPPLDL